VLVSRLCLLFNIGPSNWWFKKMERDHWYFRLWKLMNPHFCITK